MSYSYAYSQFCFRHYAGPLSRPSLRLCFVSERGAHDAVFLAGPTAGTCYVAAIGYTAVVVLSYQCAVLVLNSCIGFGTFAFVVASCFMIQLHQCSMLQLCASFETYVDRMILIAATGRVVGHNISVSVGPWCTNCSWSLWSLG